MKEIHSLKNDHLHWNDFYQFVILHTLVSEQELITVYLIFFGLPTKHISIADCQCLLSNINSHYTVTGDDPVSENYHKLAVTCPNGISSNDVAHMIMLCPDAFEPLIRFRKNCSKYIFSLRRLESIKIRNVNLDSIMIYRSEHNNKFPTGSCCEYIANLIKYHSNPFSYDFGPDQNDDLINIRHLVYQIKYVSNILTSGGVGFIFGSNAKKLKSDSINKRIDRLKYESEVYTRPLSLSSSSNMQLNQNQLNQNYSRQSTRSKCFSNSLHTATNNNLNNNNINNNVRTSLSNNSLCNLNTTPGGGNTTAGNNANNNANNNNYGLQYSQINPKKHSLTPRQINNSNSNTNTTANFTNTNSNPNITTGSKITTTKSATTTTSNTTNTSNGTAISNTSNVNNYNINNGNGFAIGSTFSSSKRGNSKIAITPLHSGGTVGRGGSDSTSTGNSTVSNNNPFSPTEIHLPNSLDSYEETNGKIVPYKHPLSPGTATEKE